MTHYELPAVDIGWPVQTQGDDASIKCTHAHREVVSLADLFEGHGVTWREMFARGEVGEIDARDVLQAPPTVRAGGVLGGARSEFVPLQFRPIAGGTTIQVVEPSEGELTAGLTDAWHNVVVKSLEWMSTSRPPLLTGRPNDDGDWVIDYEFEQTLPERAQPEATYVSVTVRGGATPPRVASFTLLDAVGVRLELPFKAFQFPGQNSHRFEVRVAQSLPQRDVLDTYLPNAPDACTISPQPQGNALIRFTSSVGLNQEIELDVVPDLHGVYEVCGAIVLQPMAPVTVARPLAGSQPPPVPARFRVAANVEQSLYAGLRGTYAGQQLLADNKPFTLSALILQAQAHGVVPTHESVRGGDAWVFELSTLLGNGRTLSFALKVRVIDVGNREVDVVDARLVDRVNSKVVWRDDNTRTPNEGLV